MELFEVDAYFKAIDDTVGHSSVGIFSTMDKALEAIRALADDDIYSGKYNEEVDSDRRNAECVYGETEDYVATQFIVSPVTLDHMYKV